MIRDSQRNFTLGADARSSSKYACWLHRAEPPSAALPRRDGFLSFPAHHIEAKFQLGANAAFSLHKGDQVLVIGAERSESWGEDGDRRYGRVIEAQQIGAGLGGATVEITRNDRSS